MRFKNYLEEDTSDIQEIIEAVIFMEDFNYLTEGIGDFGNKIKDFLPKLGLHAKKSSPGLIQVLTKAGTKMAQFFWYAMRASTGSKEAKDKVKAMANREITKEDWSNFLDLLVKLDTMTLHVVSGPIHMIEALTGWHIGAHLKTDAKSMLDKISKAISQLEDAAKGVGEKIKKKITKYIEGIKRLFSTEAIA